MHKTAVRADGCIPLGEDARRAGFAPGTLVQVIVASSGSLILAIDDTHPLDLPVRAMSGGARQGALRERWRHTG